MKIRFYTVDDNTLKNAGLFGRIHLQAAKIRPAPSWPWEAGGNGRRKCVLTIVVMRFPVSYWRQIISVSRRTCRRQVPVRDRAFVPLDKPCISILRDNDSEGIMKFVAETIGGTVPGADLFDQFLPSAPPFYIERVNNSLHFRPSPLQSLRRSQGGPAACS